MLDLLRDVPQWPQVQITVVSLLSIRVVDLCLFFFINLLPGLLDESLFMVTEKTRSLFVVYRFYLAYINTSVNFIQKMFANSRFQSIQLEELRSSLNLKLLVKVKRLH